MKAHLSVTQVTFDPHRQPDREVLDEDPRHRLRRVHRRLPRRGAARAGHEVVGLDNFSKYGRVDKRYDDHPRTASSRATPRTSALLTDLAADCDQFVAAAAMIGGISYFHEFAYDLLAENERIIAATFDAAIAAHAPARLKKIDVPRARRWSSSRRASCRRRKARSASSPPPIRTYGFQKLAASTSPGRREQYGLPYTIIRPFNCVGVGERRALARHES